MIAYARSRPYTRTGIGFALPRTNVATIQRSMDLCRSSCTHGVAVAPARQDHLGGGTRCLAYKVDSTEVTAVARGHHFNFFGAFRAFSTIQKLVFRLQTAAGACSSNSQLVINRFQLTKQNVVTTRAMLLFCLAGDRLRVLGVQPSRFRHRQPFLRGRSIQTAAGRISIPRLCVPLARCYIMYRCGGMSPCLCGPAQGVDRGKEVFQGTTTVDCSRAPRLFAFCQYARRPPLPP